jgi:hypothetical protein
MKRKALQAASKRKESQEPRREKESQDTRHCGGNTSIDKNRDSVTRSTRVVVTSVVLLLLALTFANDIEESSDAGVSPRNTTTPWTRLASTQ